MRYRQSLLLLLCSVLLPTAVSACTIPPAPANAPTPPIGQRVLIPTAQPATDNVAASTVTSGASEQIVATVAPTVAASESPLTPAQATLLAKLPSRGAAPELQNEIWFNSEPLKLADLRGKVVIVEFWTYG